MPDVFHVCPDLVGASCFQSAFHQGYIAKALQHAVVGDGTLSNVRPWWEDGHTLAVLGVASDISLDAPCFFREVAPYQCLIRAVGVVVEELCTQLCLGLWCLSDYQQSAGVFVDAVYQTHTWVVGVIAGQVSQVPGNGIHQRAVEITHT